MILGNKIQNNDINKKKMQCNSCCQDTTELFTQEKDQIPIVSTPTFLMKVLKQCEYYEYSSASPAHWVFSVAMTDKLRL